MRPHSKCENDLIREKAYLQPVGSRHVSTAAALAVDGRLCLSNRGAARREGLLLPNHRAIG